MLSALRSRGAQPGGGLLACIIAALVGAGTLAMRPDLTTAQVRVPEAGSVALRDLRAARSTRVTDQAETQRRRDDAAQAVPVVYDHARVAVDRSHDFAGSLLGDGGRDASEEPARAYRIVLMEDSADHKLQVLRKRVGHSLSPRNACRSSGRSGSR